MLISVEKINDLMKGLDLVPSHTDSIKGWKILLEHICLNSNYLVPRNISFGEDKYYCYESTSSWCFEFKLKLFFAADIILVFVNPENFEFLDIDIEFKNDINKVLETIIEAKNENLLSFDDIIIDNKSVYNTINNRFYNNIDKNI